jgi:hypothetical protein
VRLGKEREAISDGVSWRHGQTEQLAEVFAVTPAIFRGSGDEKKTDLKVVSEK